ncbi:TfoX/Sxy family protein [Micrococcus terreus]|uniref:TfoX/Sxy family protein n=1 Tax=Micrococcus terreus TaxID=574650 RepID=UPI00301691E5
MTTRADCPDSTGLRPSEVEYLIRTMLAGRTDVAGDVQEKRMFGHRAFMVRGALAVSIGEDGLLVRVDPERSELLLDRPGAEPARMGERAMGPSWIHVDTAVLDADSLADWLSEAIDYNDCLTLT